MCDSLDQQAPRSPSAQLRLSFWQLEGGTKVSHCVAASRLWEAVSQASPALALRDGRGLPRPGVARILVRLAADAKGRGEARTLALALRYACTMGRLHPYAPVPAAAVPTQAPVRGIKLLASEAEEVRLAWESVTRSGACSILANGAGNLRPGAMRALARRLKSVRQSHLFFPRETAEAMIRDLAAEVGRPRKRKGS